jgi:monoamine oxidase
MAESTAARDYDVIVIGAGVAGLRCAHQLVHEKGVHDVLVVDALDRVGGRILPSFDFIPGMAVEIGAEMLHGANTTLTRLAAEQKWNLREIFTWAQVSRVAQREQSDWCACVLALDCILYPVGGRPGAPVCALVSPTANASINQPLILSLR